MIVTPHTMGAISRLRKSVNLSGKSQTLRSLVGALVGKARAPVYSPVWSVVSVTEAFVTTNLSRIVRRRVSPGDDFLHPFDLFRKHDDIVGRQAANRNHYST